MKIAGVVSILYLCIVICSLTVSLILINFLENMVSSYNTPYENTAFEMNRHFIPTYNNLSSEQTYQRECVIPKATVLHPHCSKQVKDLQDYLRFNGCYKKFTKNKDLCSILIYLSEVESWCPHLSWRTPVPRASHAHEKSNLRENLDELLTKKLSNPSYKWMRRRIKSMEKNWIRALSALGKKNDFSYRSKKRVLIFLGAFVFTPFLTEEAFSGGPLGELVQWSDIIASLYLLGHHIDIAISKEELLKYVPRKDKDGCLDKTMLDEKVYDLVLTDITGTIHFRTVVGPYWSHFRCKVRVIDSFGTEAEFNIPNFQNGDPRFHSIWGGLGLNLRQFMTMYPHSPDNTFMGFVCDSKEIVANRKIKNRENIGMVYGKEDFFYGLGSKNYLDTIHKYVEVHGTYNASLGTRPDYIPDYIINHGVLNRAKFQKMLQKAKVFIGFGFPFEGPAPLEAIANGAMFLNRKYSTPLDRNNNFFFRDKPTRRPMTSQNPYTEQFIGEPYVYTINIKNLTEVENTMKKVMQTNIEPYIPYEFTNEGMLERVSFYTENLNVCDNKVWPPLKNMVIVKGRVGQSCKDACWEKNLLCEPSYWETINSFATFKKARFKCSGVQNVDMTVAPSYHSKSNICYLQQNPLLFSCVKSATSHIRLCPCRDYVKGQVAMCKDCW